MTECNNILECFLDNLGLLYLNDISKICELMKDIKEDYENQDKKHGIVEYFGRMLRHREDWFIKKYSKYLYIPKEHHCVTDIEYMNGYKELDGTPMFKNTKKLDSNISQSWYNMISKEIIYGEVLYKQYLKLDAYEREFIRRKLVNFNDEKENIQNDV